MDLVVNNSRTAANALVNNFMPEELVDYLSEESLELSGTKQFPHDPGQASTFQ